MRHTVLSLILLMLIVGCAPATQPIITQPTQPLSATFTPKPIQSTPTVAPTATLTPTITPNPAQQIGLPESLKQQFPLSESPEKYWSLYGNPDETGYLANFNQPAGDLIIVSVVKFRYLNGAGEADFVYIPIAVINPDKKLCLTAGFSRPAYDCARLLNDNGTAFNPENKTAQDNSALQSFLPSRKQIAELRFGYPTNLTKETGAKGLLDNAVKAIYPDNLLAEFAATGDSKLLPNRMLIPWFFQASYTYSIQVATPTPFPVVDLPADIPAGAVLMDELSAIPSIARQKFPLTRDLNTNEAIFHCLSGKTNYEYIQITDTVLATGTLDCHYLGGMVKIPLGIYDMEQNRLIFWGLGVVEDVSGLDYLAVRAERRFTSLIPNYQFEYKTNRLANLKLGLSLGHPKEKYLRALNTQNFAMYIDAWYADEQRLAELLQFIETGTPSGDGFLFPFDIGIGSKE